MTVKQGIATSPQGATFSPCRKWRYALWRVWGDGRLCAFIGLNPSTADETQDDPTIRRCIGFAKREGCSGLVMLNAFAWRDTDPRGMKSASDPIGPDNDATIATVAQSAGVVIAAWGALGTFMDRDRDVAKLVDDQGRSLMCLGTTKGGQPRHPLYLRSDALLLRYV